jgi:hypothetical protein
MNANVFEIKKRFLLAATRFCLIGLFSASTTASRAILIARSHLYQS